MAQESVCWPKDAAPWRETDAGQEKSIKKTPVRAFLCVIFNYANEKTQVPFRLLLRQFHRLNRFDKV